MYLILLISAFFGAYLVIDKYIDSDFFRIKDKVSQNESSIEKPVEWCNDRILFQNQVVCCDSISKWEWFQQIWSILAKTTIWIYIAIRDVNSANIKPKYLCEQLDDVDVNTIAVIGDVEKFRWWFYFTDKNWIYYTHWKNKECKQYDSGNRMSYYTREACSQLPIKIPQVHNKSFEYIWYGYAYDNNNVYYWADIIDTSNWKPNIELGDNSRSTSKPFLTVWDKVYVDWLEVSWTSANWFKNWYKNVFSDKVNWIYHKDASWKITTYDLDIETFWFDDKWMFFYDKNWVYVWLEHNTITYFENADSNSFVKVCGQYSNCYYSDKDNVYSSKSWKMLEWVDPDTLIQKKRFWIDENSVFSQWTLIDLDWEKLSFFSEFEWVFDASQNWWVYAQWLSTDGNKIYDLSDLIDEIEFVDILYNTTLNWSNEELKQLYLDWLNESWYDISWIPLSKDEYIKNMINSYYYKLSDLEECDNHSLPLEIIRVEFTNRLSKNNNSSSPKSISKLFNWEVLEKFDECYSK